jgi:hypothetical protein
VKTTLSVPANVDTWGISIRNNSANTTFSAYEVQFWTTN